MATIDLLGALVAGRADRWAKTSPNARAYLTRFVRYTEEQARVLQQMFRHKLVHLAAPRATIEDRGRVISWRYVHCADPAHLTIQPIQGSSVPVWTGWDVPCDHEFVLSTAQLVRDIMNSVVKVPGGYLDRLALDGRLRENFERAFETIYDRAQA